MTDHPRYSADDRAHWRSCTYDVAYAVDALLSWPLHTTRDLEAIRTQIQAMHPCHLDVALWNLARWARDHGARPGDLTEWALGHMIDVHEAEGDWR